mgnify:CR=1 FL=1
MSQGCRSSMRSRAAAVTAGAAGCCRPVCSRLPASGSEPTHLLPEPDLALSAVPYKLPALTQTDTLTSTLSKRSLPHPCSRLQPLPPARRRLLRPLLLLAVELRGGALGEERVHGCP